MRAAASGAGATRDAAPHPKGEGKRAGFSLLEVILALAILCGAMAALGELARQGMRSAAYVRDMAQAQLLCESKLSQIAAGIELPEPVAGAYFAPEDLVDPYDETGWYYTIETADVEEPGVIAVMVTVGQDLPPAKRPARFTLARWIVDPGIELSEPAEEAEASSNSDSGSEGGGDGT